MVHVRSLVKQLEAVYYIDEDMIRDAINRHTEFNVIHLEPMLQVDIFIPKPRAFDQEELKRVQQEVLVEGERAFYLSSTMAEQQGDRMAHFMARGNQPLIGVFRQEKGREIVHYFSDEEEADEASSLRGIREALGLAGAWSDLNWDEAEKELYRIRHKSQPTPPSSL